MYWFFSWRHGQAYHRTSIPEDRDPWSWFAGTGFLITCWVVDAEREGDAPAVGAPVRLPRPPAVPLPTAQGGTAAIALRPRHPVHPAAGSSSQRGSRGPPEPLRAQGQEGRVYLQAPGGAI